MVDLNISLPESFFDEEERCGYLVSAKTKEFWAVELDLLQEFDRVCKKFNIKYILDFGTLLGAIRHKGFIPWDVDMDVSMLREDYEKLSKIAPKEFRHPYFFQNQFTEIKYNHCIARLRRSDTTSLNLHDIIYRRKTNQGIFLDIFVFDNVPMNDFKSVDLTHSRCKEIGQAIFVLSEPPTLKSYGTKFSFFYILRYLYYKLRYGSLNNAWRMLEKTASKYDRSCYVCSMYSNMETRIRPREWFENLIQWPFENLMLPIPEAYDELLKMYYGDYMIPVVDNGITVLLTDASRSYTDIINEQGFYEKICNELNLDINQFFLSDWDFLKMLMKKIHSHLSR